MAKICPLTDKPVLYASCQDCEERLPCLQGGMKPVFALLVVGSRSVADYAFVKKKLDALIGPVRSKYRFLVVSGGAGGADKLAERYAAENRFEMKVMRAEWEKHGKRAGYVRNDAMHRFISAYEHRGAVAFWDGASRGTCHSIGLAKKYDNPFRIIIAGRRRKYNV